MYQQELGAWQILDPLEKVRQGKSSVAKTKLTHLSYIASHSAEDIEYVPCFVFNSEHLWRVRSPQEIAGKPLQVYLRNRKFWADFDPSFAAGVHNFIFEQALKGMSEIDLLAVKIASIRVDVNVLFYDPRDHFDFAYVSEGWELVGKRLKSGSLDDFGLAIHAIGDFYAHSMRILHHCTRIGHQVSSMIDSKCSLEIFPRLLSLATCRRMVITLSIQTQGNAEA